MAAPLASAVELKNHLQQTVPPDVSALALAGASGAVRSYCGWDLLRETRTFVVEGDGSVILTLPTLHLVTINAIRVGGLTVDPAGIPQPIPHERGQLVWATSWPVGSLVEIDAVHGYETAPDVVKLVTLTLAARIVTNPDDAKSASVGSVSRTYDTTMTALDMRLLDPYRL